MSPARDSCTPYRPSNTAAGHPLPERFDPADPNPSFLKKVQMLGNHTHHQLHVNSECPYCIKPTSQPIPPLETPSDRRSRPDKGNHPPHRATQGQLLTVEPSRLCSKLLNHHTDHREPTSPKKPLAHGFLPSKVTTEALDCTNKNAREEICKTSKN